jgi:flavin reductase (DIM6/NTAB) family NADH-FMN oxidoreductase RutF
VKKQTVLAGETGFTLFYIGSIALVTALDNEGRADICTIGDWAQCSMFPHTYGFALCNRDEGEKVFKRYTLECIEQTGEFVINVPDMHLSEAWMKCGTTSLRRTPDLDKFAFANLTRAEGAIVKAPLIAECAVNIECRLAGKLSVCGYDWVVGEAVAIHRAFADDGSQIAVPILPLTDVCPTMPRLK